MSLRQLEYYGPLPTSFKYHIILSAFISLAMIGTSASFRYDSLGLTGRNIALVPDVASSCNQSLVTHSNYFCNGGTAYTNLNANTTGSSWSYLEEVYTGGQRTVYRYGEPGDQELGANVTLGVLPAGWTLNEGNDLPWMEMWVTCNHLSISAEFSGSNYTTALRPVVHQLPWPWRRSAPARLANKQRPPPASCGFFRLGRTQRRQQSLLVSTLRLFPL